VTPLSVFGRFGKSAKEADRLLRNFRMHFPASDFTIGNVERPALDAAWKHWRVRGAGRESLRAPAGSTEEMVRFVINVTREQ
jgi:hypothetical protein